MAKYEFSYSKTILETLKAMEVGDSFDKEKFILKHRFIYDFWQDRSFSALFCIAKKELPEKKFQCIKGQITRIS